MDKFDNDIKTSIKDIGKQIRKKLIQCLIKHCRVFYKAKKH